MAGRAATWRLTRPALAWLCVAAILAFVGWFKTINLMLLAGYGMLALLGLNAALAYRAASRFRAAWVPSPPVYARRECRLACEASNPAGRAGTLRLSARSPHLSAAWFLVRFRTGRSQRLHAAATFPRRGVYELPAPVAASSYPFGLVEVGRAAGEAGSALVLPAVGQIDRVRFRRWLIRGGAGDNAVRLVRPSAHSGDGDVRGLRAYRPGDSPREIHWRTSARRGQLLVREYDLTEPLDLVVLLDPGAPLVAGDERLEWCVELVATLAASWGEEARSELTVGVLGAAGLEYRRGRAGAGFAREALKLVAGAEGVAEVPALRLFDAGNSGRRAARLVVSPDPGGALAAGCRAAGWAVRELHPGAPPAWYLPPPASPPVGE